MKSGQASGGQLVLQQGEICEIVGRWRQSLDERVFFFGHGDDDDLMEVRMAWDVVRNKMSALDRVQDKVRTMDT